MTFIIFFLILIFVSINAAVFFGLKLVFRKENLSQSSNFLSIVIAAKNEERNLPDLFSSLKTLDYEHNKFEVIFIDDNSSDNTYNIAVELGKGIHDFKIIKCTEKPFAGKKGALAVGIQSAKFPFILTTDADCTPENGWLKTYSNYFDKDFDFLFGIAPFHQKKNLINKISCFENLRNSILYFSSAKANFSYSASARNFGFRKEAYLKIGGYTNTTETLSGDDDLLLREAIKYKMKIRCVIEQGSWVFSATKNTLREYLQQKARHAQTSFHYLLSRQIVLGLWHLLNLIMMLSPVLFFIDAGFILLFITKILIDLIMIKLIQTKFGYSFQLPEVISLQIFYEFFLILNFLNASAKKVEWK